MEIWSQSASITVNPQSKNYDTSHSPYITGRLTTVCPSKVDYSMRLLQSNKKGTSAERSFSFVKPKIDYRYNLTQSFQVRLEIERDISQLSFSDFSASVDSNDEEKNTFAGNPEIVQEKLWRYDLNLEYRLPNDLGVINSDLLSRRRGSHRSD